MSCNYEGLGIPTPKEKQVKADWTTKISPCVNTNHQPSQYIYRGGGPHGSTPSPF
jgi:hypothetical protein